MKPLKPETVLPTLAVLTWKAGEMTKMECAIVKHALAHHYVYPGDIPEDTIAKQHRNGVASNCWGVLESAGIIAKCPLSFTDETRKIVGGRKRNVNVRAKGRWTAVYFLASRSLAEALLVRVGAQPPLIEQVTQLALC